MPDEQISRGRVNSAFSAYATALLRRLDYMGRTQRLSDTGCAELERLSEEIRSLNTVLPTVDLQPAFHMPERSDLLAAYWGELDRHGRLVLADSLEIRQQSAAVRAVAERARANSQRRLSGFALRVVKQPEPISLQMLDRMLEVPA